MAGLESLMWALEPDPRIRTGVAAVLFVDDAPSRDALLARMREMAATNPRLRSTIAGRPRPFSTLRWRVLPEIDPADHVTFTSASDGEADVMGIAEAMMEAAYDRDRPLWDVRVITDLPGGGAAIVVRLHHCLTDGLGSMILAAQFFDAGASGTRLLPPPEPDQTDRPPRRIPARAAAVTDSLLEDAATIGAASLAVGRTLPGVAAATARRPATALQQGAAYAASTVRILKPAPNQLSPVLQQHSGRTRITTLDVDLAEMKRAGKALGGSVNDVFLTVLSRALHDYHVAVSGEPVDHVRLNMPINSRTAADSGPGGNHFVPLRILLPLTSGDVPRGVARVSAVAGRAKAEPALGITPYISGLLGRLPSALGAKATNGMYHGVDTAASNFPGPPIPLWVAGSRVTHLYAVGPRSGGAFATTMISYNGVAHLAINMDAGAVAQPDVLLRCLDEALADVLRAGADVGEARVAV